MQIENEEDKAKVKFTMAARNGTALTNDLFSLNGDKIRRWVFITIHHRSFYRATPLPKYKTTTYPQACLRLCVEVDKKHNDQEDIINMDIKWKRGNLLNI